MIYLDSAATSLHKPPEVGAAMLWALRHCGSTGRGNHAAVSAAEEIVFSCRKEAAALFGVREPDRVVFTQNATHGLNIAIRSLVRPGMPVLVFGYEHNAVMRPLYDIGADILSPEAPLFSTAELLDFLQENISSASCVICTHVSNVFGYILPLREIAAECRRARVPLIVDAAQSAGVLDINMSELDAAFVAMPGHKALMGPQGTGLLLCGERGKPLLFGGTGGNSASRTMPEFLPDRLEAGTLNVCGIAGLQAALRFIRYRGQDTLRKREDYLLRLLTEGLQAIPGLCVFAPPEGQHVSAVSVLHPGLSCERMAELMGKNGVAVRAGLHCAPLAHRTAGTDSTGTLRMSVSPMNTEAEIRQVLRIIKKISEKGNKM